ncbi:MAG: hypothetical protein B7Z75_06300 [Acidocella sp. 20-57-95]|nr:MAG: hypothetical protein B7Z75_06300 [Acidocella sp. 20-57-95]OYV60317.1 MAG: hypothetical protein B7Z71_06435 [Acidocella sp. 21-58-7]HQT63444.1 PQQ-binding-like beta-propeller repeat protein [Acidocella sp.]HQU04778.1 PQQ-binding-like beta-propeller repeat protein [Acidocella sp.]
MTKTLGRRMALMMPIGLLPLSLASCGDAKKATAIGVQIPVQPETSPLEVAVNPPKITMPAAVALRDWPQSLCNPSHAAGNMSGPANLGQSWHVGIGAGGGYRQPLAASPIVAEGKIFAMDANGKITAVKGADGTQVWRTDTKPKHATELNIGGGLAYHEGLIYVSTGYSELVAISPTDGKIIWRQKLDFPARSAPAIGNGLVAVITQNDLLMTFLVKTGTPSWRFVGKIMDQPASVSVIGAPAIDDGILVAGFSSGTLAALDINSGTPIWEKSLASSFGQSNPLDFSDIAAAPVIYGGVVYAISLGGSLQAIDLRSGAKVWEHNAAGNQPVCAVGKFIYVLTLEQKLVAIHQDDGLVCWSLDMPAYKNMKAKTNPIQWNAPLMVNNLLLLTNDHSELAYVDPFTGTIGATARLFGPSDMTPIAAGYTLIILTRNATLAAYS